MNGHTLRLAGTCILLSTACSGYGAWAEKKDPGLGGAAGASVDVGGSGGSGGSSEGGAGGSDDPAPPAGSGGGGGTTTTPTIASCPDDGLDTADLLRGARTPAALETLDGGAPDASDV